MLLMQGPPTRKKQVLHVTFIQKIISQSACSDTATETSSHCNCHSKELSVQNSQTLVPRIIFLRVKPVVGHIHRKITEHRAIHSTHSPDSGWFIDRHDCEQCIQMWCHLDGFRGNSF